VSRRRVYLSGGIEHSGDGGRGWRSAIGAFLAGELGHEVYDPARDEKKDLTDEERRELRGWKTGSPERFRDTVRKIIAWDLGRIEKHCDYVLAFWDDSAARGGGTAAEITLAYRLNKPVYLVLGMPRAAASGWVLAAATEVFEDFEALKSRLREEFGKEAPTSPPAPSS
jgi:nucleoside 2-deoxyribosyltransferase